MTKSTITRERLEQLADNNTICKVSWDERIELAQIALSVMAGEPVAWTWHYREQWHVTNDELRAEFVAKDGDVAVLPLYRHAQPAQVVQCPFPCGWDNLNKLAIQDAALVARGLVEGELTTEAHRQAAISNNDRLLKVISACRAAMLAAAPQSPGSEPATAPGTWIPVSERLPEAGGDMIVFTDGIVMSGVSYAKKKGFYIQALEYDDDEPVDSVTHWMPLPAAPQEVQGE
nr:DUF551 domain-containing protein [Klebsiella variicola]